MQNMLTLFTTFFLNISSIYTSYRNTRFANKNLDVFVDHDERSDVEDMSAILLTLIVNECICLDIVLSVSDLD